MSYKIHTVNFGQAYGGLSTVGYTLYNIDGSIKVARATTGVVEYGTSTGIYGANISYSEFDQLIVLWDTGGASPRYAIEENRTTLAQIQDETDHIRLIWNTLRNQGELYTRLLKKLDQFESKELKDYSEELKNLKIMLDDLISREKINLKDIKEALDIELPAPVVNLPAPQVNITEREINIPDYTSQIEAIRSALVKTQAIVDSLPKKAQDYSSEFSKIAVLINAVMQKIPADGKQNLGILLKAINDVEIKIKDLCDESKESMMEHGGSIKDVDGKMESIKQSMDSLIKVIPPAHLFMLLKHSLGFLQEEEKKISNQKLKNALGVK